MWNTENKPWLLFPADLFITRFAMNNQRLGYLVTGKNKFQPLKIETRKSTEKINKTKSWIFEKINKIGKPLTRLRKKEKTQN